MFATRKLPYRYGEVPDAIPRQSHNCLDCHCGTDAIPERCPKFNFMDKDSGTPCASSKASTVCGAAKVQAACEICSGKYREEIGRETIVGGRLICDYCHAQILKVEEEMRRQAVCGK